MRIAAAAALLALLHATGLAAAHPPADGARKSSHFTVYECNGYVGSGEGAGGSIELHVSYLEDGALWGKSVSFYAQNAPFIGTAPPATASVQLRWPGEHRVGHEGETFDWSKASVQISLSASLGARAQKDERWRRVLVDRSDAVTTYDYELSQAMPAQGGVRRSDRAGLTCTALAGARVSGRALP